MATPILFVKGTDGQIELLPDRVVIHRKGFLNFFKYGIDARREIPLISISGVGFRPAHFFNMGRIEFDHAGRTFINSTHNAVRFAQKHQDDFIQLKDKVFEIMQQLQQTRKG